MEAKSARNLCFTLNNYTDKEVEDLRNLKHKYMVLGYEVGEEGTPHIQGYVEFTNSVRFSTLKKFNSRIHWEMRRGTAAQAADYCKKDGEYEEDGEISKQGARMDLIHIQEMINEGESLKKVMDEHFSTFVRYHTGITKAKMMTYKNRKTRPKVIWLFGPTGVGKSYTATEKHKSHYIKDNTKWWDGYTQQEAIIIDDFRPEKWDFSTLLRLLDKYKYQGECKGGYIKINSPYIYITCPDSPFKIWQGKDLDQVMRRIWKIKDLENEWAQVDVGEWDDDEEDINEDEFYFPQKKTWASG